MKENLYSYKRDGTIDVVKGIGIILMVGGHCNMPATHFIYLFHMALFFIASGYCWKETNSESATNMLMYIKRKFRSLWFPYFFG